MMESQQQQQQRQQQQEEVSFEKYDGSQVTESMLEEASRLFSGHYGVWGEDAARVVGKFAKAGEF